MKQVQLVFPNAADVWNFLTLTRVPNVEVRDKTMRGFFADDEIALARTDFSAEVQDFVPSEEPANETTVTPSPVTAAGRMEQEVTLVGQSGNTYHGTLYTKDHHLALLPAQAIICLSNSTPYNGGWHHAVNAIYRSDDVPLEMERFKARQDLSHIIVIPFNPAEQKGLDPIDDLIRSYLHQ